MRIYDRLFAEANPGKADDVLSEVNPDSLKVISTALIEPSIASVAPESVLQFEREGYFVADRYDHSEATPVFNMTIGLRDTWSAGDA